MNVLVTGGTGFIGSHLAQKLIKDSHTVYLLSRSGNIPDNLANVPVHIVQGNFNEEAVLDRVLPGIDIVIHLAWSSVPSQDIKEIEQDIVHNINGTITLLNKCIANHIKKFIFISSGGTVYGIPGVTPITEEHSLNPISSYGVGKVAVEKYLHLYHKLFGLDYLIFRVSNAYGEYQNLQKGQGVIGIWLDHILSGNEIVIWGDGNVIRDYVYVTDIAHVISHAVSHSMQQKIYNLGFGQGHSLNEIIELIKENITTDFKVQYLPKRDIDVPVNVLDISKLANEIDFVPGVSIEEGLTNVWSWIKQKNS
jgi:UDP-glucose 4-epimerase